jgi:hypothetical protein
VWLLVDPRTPDLASQVYRVGLFRDFGFSIWDEHWYGGHQLPGYSLLFPPLGALLGVRAVGALSVLASALLFERFARALYGDAARWGALWFALAALGDVWAGRVTFALGVSLALAAALALLRGHPLAAALLAALCAAASPVAGALLGLAALSVAIADRSPRALLVLACPAAAIVLGVAVLFPEGGYEPYPLTSFVATVLVVGLFLAALPSEQRVLRIGGWVYLAACVLCLLVESPLGSNIERYGVLLAGPLLLCALLAPPRERAAPGDGEVSGDRPQPGDRAVPGDGAPAQSEAAAPGDGVAAWRGRLTPLALIALCAAALWTLWGPVRETRAVADSAATSASYYVPVERFLARTDAPVRIEVPLTRSHWEAALLAPSVSLALGWDKQLEDKYDRVLLSSTLNAASYHRWLLAQAVSYVALPDVALDPPSAREGRLIRGGLPYLKEVFSSAHWRIYAVQSPTPLVSGPGTLTALGHDSFSLRAARAGDLVVRVHYTRYWTLTSGHGCVARAPGGWTRVSVTAPGRVVVAARFSLARAVGSVGSCARSGGVS